MAGVGSGFIGGDNEIHDQVFLVLGPVSVMDSGGHGLAAIAQGRSPGQINTRLLLCGADVGHADALIVRHKQGVPIPVHTADFDDVVAVQHRQSGKKKDFIGLRVAILNGRQGIEQDQVGQGVLQIGLDSKRRGSGQDQLLFIELIPNDLLHVAGRREPEVPGPDQQHQSHDSHGLQDLVQFDSVFYLHALHLSQPHLIADLQPKSNRRHH